MILDSNLLFAAHLDGCCGFLGDQEIETFLLGQEIVSFGYLCDPKHILNTFKIGMLKALVYWLT